jgi:excisionase family DNA binding protein
MYATALDWQEGSVRGVYSPLLMENGMDGDASKTQTIAEAAKALGIGRNQAYAAAKRGELPVIKIGKRILVLREPFMRMLRGEAA